MNKEDIKVGDTVKGIFVKYGKHLVCGEAFEVSTDDHGLPRYLGFFKSSMWRHE